MTTVLWRDFTVLSHILKLTGLSGFVKLFVFCRFCYILCIRFSFYDSVDIRGVDTLAMESTLSKCFPSVIVREGVSGKNFILRTKVFPLREEPFFEEARFMGIKQFTNVISR